LSGGDHCQDFGGYFSLVLLARCMDHSLARLLYFPRVTRCTFISREVTILKFR
jgi:hypothetical protein